MKRCRSWGRGLAGFMLAALLAGGMACESQPPVPEVKIGPPGDPAKCTLGAGKAEFTIYDPFAFVLEMHRPFGGDTVTIRSVTFADDGVTPVPLMEKTLRVLPDQERLCVVDPEVKGETFFGKNIGEMALQVLQDGRLVTQARYYAHPVPSPAVEEPAAADKAREPEAK